MREIYPYMTKSIRRLDTLFLCTPIGLGLYLGLIAPVHSAPYASGVSFQGTTVNFTLNEPADVVAISINGGSFSLLDGGTKGLKTFNLGSASDTFSIAVYNNDPVGYTIPTGNVINPAASGLSQATAEGGFNLLSIDTDPLVRFNSPRGVTVATNPNNPQFGTSYISNSASGTTTVRSLGDGLYGLKADQSDAFGYGDSAVSLGFETGTPSASSPFRITIGGDHNVYVADWSDAYGGVYRVSPTLLAPTQILAGVGGPGTLPVGQNHGSISAVHVTGTASGLTVYTVDEDLTSSQFGGASTTDKNSLWQYDVGNSALPYDGTPTKLSGALLNIAGVVNDMDRGANGYFYLSQFRQNGLEGGIIVLDANGSVLFNSLTESRTLLGDPLAPDIFRNVQAIALSLDQTYLAAMLNNSDVAILPLANGIPLLANRMVINT
ncbi:MAG TPA: hypothetical protein VFG14_05915, partial [Chthoniobacteraceae bacterium]|nr:hypothetical protein [Chthoniobacteraceae bacterium]